MVGKIWEGYPPFFFLAVDMVFVDKPIDSFMLTDVALIVLAIMFVSDVFLELEEFRKKRVIDSSWYQGFWGFGVYLGMSAIGTKILVKLSNSMRYACCLAGWVGSRGIFTTVPVRMVWVDGSSWLTRVPGG